MPRFPGAFVNPASPIEWSHPLNRGLVNDWTILPNSGWKGGTSLRDIVAGGRRARDGTLSGSYTWNGAGPAPGRYGSIKGGTATLYAINPSAFTFTFWMYDSDATNDHVGILQTDGVSVTSFKFTSDMVSSGNSYFTLSTSGGTYTVNDSGLFRAPNAARQHYIITWDGSTLALYRNGVQRNTTSTTGTMSFNSSCVAKLNVGLASIETEGFSYRNVAYSLDECHALFDEVRYGNPERLQWNPKRTWFIQATSPPPPPPAGNVFYSLQPYHW